MPRPSRQPYINVRVVPGYAGPRAAMNEAMLQIGQLADRVGLSLRTVRYYEETGLVEPSRRTDGGFRLYTSEHIARLELIKHMKPLGFSLQQMRELLDARDALLDDSLDSDARERAREQLAAFATVAAGACDGLREKLERGDEFVTRLRSESRAPRTTARHA